MNASTITYDPFVTAGAEGSVRVAVDLVDGESCDAIIALSDENGVPLRSLTFGPGDGVAFRPQLRPDSGARASTEPAEAIVTLSAADPHAEVVWRLLGTGDGILAPGDYTVQVRAQLRSPVNAFAPVVGAVSLRSIARAQINLAGTAGSYDTGADTAAIDLGELHEGSSGRAFLQLRANTAANVSFQSEHRGFLLNAIGGGRIAYRLSFDGKDVDLAQSISRTVPPAPSLRGVSLELLVQVGDVTAAAAGRYGDTIVIDVSP